MKFLVIGIDGIDADLVRDLPMPFLQTFLNEDGLPQLTEDLWSRGWAEVISGAHGRDTGAFYCRPKVPGGHLFTQSYRKDDFAAAKAARPLWEVLALRGVTTGFMNIPTTFPAPQIDGFFVSGAGSGLSGSGAASIPVGAVHPVSLADELSARRYVFDLRARASGIDRSEELLMRLGEMAHRRADSFIVLSEKTRPQFGFVAFMAARSLLNLAMADIVDMRRRGMQPDGGVQEVLLSAFGALDEAIRRIVEALQPAALLFVSDHGTTTYKQRIDTNVVLAELGYQVRNVKHASRIAPLKKVVKKVLPARLMTAAKQNVPLRLVGTGGASHGIDLSRSRAFSARYVPGVYVNDERFGGPVSGGSTALAGEIAAAFNALPAVRAAGLKAVPYRQQFETSQFAWLCPDVWIEHPDEIFFEHGVGEAAPSNGLFLSPNENYGRLGEGLDDVRDLWTGIKRRHPLFVGSKGLACLVEDDDPQDLRLVHRIVERTFS